MANLTFSPTPQGTVGFGQKTNLQSSTPKTTAGSTDIYNTSNNNITPTASSSINSGIMGIPAKTPYSNLVTSKTNTIPSSLAAPKPTSGTMSSDGSSYTIGSADKFNPFTGQSLTSDQTPGTVIKKAASSTNSQGGSSNGGIFGTAANNLSNTGSGKSGGTVSTATGGLMSQAFGQNPASTQINNLEGIAENQTPAVTQAQTDYNKFAQSSPYMTAAQYNPNVAADVASGRAGLLGQTFAQELGAKQAAVNNAIAGEGQQITAGTNAGNQALTGQGQQITAGTNAGNLGVSQEQTQNQAANELLGTPGGALSTYGLMGEGTNGGNLNPQNNASSLAQQVINGKISYQDAVNSLGYTGSVGQQMLNEAIQTINPGFNIQQAQANTQIQGTLGPQGNLASAELNNLQTTLNSMPGLQNTSIPLINQFTRWLGGLTGNASSQQLADAQSAATSAVKTALGTAYGGTPTSFDALVNAWFPPGATPDQVQAGIQQFNALMQARQQSFSSPGTTSFSPAGGANTSTNTSTNSYGFSSYLGS